MVEEKPITLDDYSNQILTPAMVKLTADIIFKDIDLLKNIPPPTRKQRIQWWIEDKKQRVKDIWTILSGGDIHGDCGGY